MCSAVIRLCSLDGFCIDCLCLCCWEGVCLICSFEIGGCYWLSMFWLGFNIGNSVVIEMLFEREVFVSFGSLACFVYFVDYCGVVVLDYLWLGFCC